MISRTSPNSPDPEAASVRRGLLAVLAAAAVFAVDVLVPRGIAVGALYVVVVALAILVARGPVVAALAGLCTVLAAGAVALKAPSPLPMHAVLVNRGISIVAIWTVALMVLVAQRRRGAAKAAEAQRDRAEALLHRAIQQVPDAIFIVGHGGDIAAANPAAHRIFGYDHGALVGSSIDALVPEPLRSVHAAHREGYAAQPMVREMGTGRVCRGIRKDGTELSIEVSLAPAGSDGLVVAALRDISERVRFEERTRSAQRMEAIGRLAGGVAHDFNNLLAVIMSCAEVMREEESAPRDDIADIFAAARRGADLTKQLLAFSRRQIISPRRIDVNELVANMHKLLGRTLGEDIEIETRLEPDPWAVVIDPSQLEQVVLNLVVNARDAMPRGGKLTLETGNVELDEQYTRTHPDVSPGQYVLLAVSDSGAGMTADVRQRIFEPFFSTKPPGVGSGLGLATVYGIVKQAEGHIWVYSEPGRGSTFKVYLPRTSGEVDRAEPVRPSQRPPGRGEDLLVVEDEPAVRRVIVRTLRRGGYNVVEAANGHEALAKLETLGGRIALLVTDVVMPQMGGRALGERVNATYPDVRILFLSGYTENAIVHHGVLDQGLVFLEKPFSSDALLRKVRDLLDAPATK